MKEESLSNSLVSVVIPVYNVESYLCQCIDSVIDQTYKHMEIILVDDGSTDKCPEMCDRYKMKDDRIIVVHKPNGGLSDARNVGLSLTTGKYVLFLDSDDLIKPDSVQKLVEISEGYQLDLLFFCAEPIDEKGEIITDKFLSARYIRSENDYIVSSGKELFAKMVLKKEYYSCVPMIFIRKDVIKNRFEAILHEDELYTILLSYSADRTMCCNYQFYRRRFRKDSIMTEKASIEHIEGYSFIVERLLELYGDDNIIIYYCSRLYQSLLRAYNGLTRREKKIALTKKQQLDSIIKSKKYYHSERLRLLVAFSFLYPVFEKIYIIYYRKIKKNLR